MDRQQEARQVAYEVARAKQEEDTARGRRIALEERLVQLLGFDKPEGSKTTDLGDGYKVSCTQPVARKLIRREWDTFAREYPEQAAHLSAIGVVVAEPKVGDAKYKALLKEDPKWAPWLAHFIESRPGKVGVKVTIQEQEPA